MTNEEAKNIIYRMVHLRDLTLEEIEALGIAFRAIENIEQKKEISDPPDPCTVCQEFDCTGCEFLRRTKNDRT